ncbi:MAG: hypothetical protein PWP37_1014 [Thermotogota bacterium]|nr:hypothetical protein [Thermotogota bacterium]MDK2864822.1 hypothetical protein [Thermotogota bacterium]HCZ06462.1 hypothetical protein [Thermotogota bacterium]
MKKKRGPLWGRVVLLLLLLFIISANAVAIFRYVKAKEELALAEAHYKELLKRVNVLEDDLKALEQILKQKNDGEK